MKILGNIGYDALQSATGVQKTGSASSARGKGRAGEGTSVRLSSEAKWIASVREEARDAPPIREDVVARMRQAIADGSFASTVSMDEVVDNLLSEL